MDGLCFKAGIQAAWFSSPISVAGAVVGRSHPVHICALGRATNSNGISLENSTTTAAPPQRPSLSSRFSFTYPFVSIWPSAGIGEPNGGAARDDDDVVVAGNGDDRQVIAGDGDHNGNGDEDEPMTSGDKLESWVLKILHVRSLWSEQGNTNVEELGRREEENIGDDALSGRSGGCSCCHDGDSEVRSVDEGGEEEKKEQDEQQEIKFDRDSFSRFLRRVSLAETQFYAQMSYLGNLAYSIPQIKPGNLLKYHGLRFVTSSLEKKRQSKNVEKEETVAQVQETEKPVEASEAEEQMKKNDHQISASAAYRIAASAASYLHSQTKSILPFKSTKAETEEDSPRDGGATGSIETTSSDVASFVETTNSLTAVVAAEEETKQAVAKNLNSVHSSPCEWFICDDDRSETRFFVIQGSESLASWQTNLLFEPIQFEGLDVPVHWGIYEAAKGMYEQILPEVHAHLKSCGDSATFRFTGHSLGGSLSLLLSLMLLIRGEVPQSSLLPVITFGAPSIMCGGDQLLHKLGLPRSYVKAITMHRDIVPRAFSCNYPDRVAELLKAVNANFRNHPCLNNQKMLYGPMGELLILQPEEKFSPGHHLLPSGSGLYLLQGPMSDSCDAEKQLWAAQSVFLNSPHPLEILSDRSAYGSDGTIYRDHDMNSYFRSVRIVIKHERNLIRKAKREQRRKMWWPLVAPRSILASIILDNRVAPGYRGQHQPHLSGIFRNGRRTLKRFSRLIASQHMPLLVLLLFPVRLFWGLYTLIDFW